MSMQKMLEKLNIPEREARVYIALLSLGLTPVSALIDKTKMHRMLVYEALAKLKDLHMATMLIKDGIQHWQAANPSVICDRINEQQEIAKLVVRELEEIKGKDQEEVSIQILYGTSGLRENLDACVKSAAATDHIIRIFGGTRDSIFYDAIGDWYQTYSEMLKKYEVKKKLIGTADYSDTFSQKFKKENGNEYRIMRQGLTTPTFERFTQELVCIEIYASKEPIIIQIKNKAIAHAYIEKFELLWRNSDIPH